MRTFSSSAIVVAAALVVASCGGGTTPTPTPTPVAYVDAPILQPDANGVYQLTLAPAAVEIGGKRYCLRTYNGFVPGPTIRVPAGKDRRIHVDLHNGFTKSDYREIISFAGHGTTSCHDFNMTNLHGHGLHVQPTYATADAADACKGDGCGPGGEYYGDNVLLEWATGVTG